MKTMGFVLLLASLLNAGEGMVIDHTCTKFDRIPGAFIDSALAKLHIVYTHTSHGSQLTDGMAGLAAFKKDARLGFKRGGGGCLDLHDYGCSEFGAYDLGNPDRTEWEKATRKYLAAYPRTNVVVWSWCGQVEWATPQDIDLYLSLMSGLERDFPAVRFVYMTGHVVEGARGNNHERNEQIRRYCRENGKILYDFADIECYDPDGNYFGDKWCTDGCFYDKNGDGDPWNDGANWAIEWQNAHVEGVDWYNCNAAHTEPLNANQKAYAAWWLWARLAGWQGAAMNSGEGLRPLGFVLKQNYPNPFNNSTRIEFELPASTEVELVLYEQSGRRVRTLFEGRLPAGTHMVELSAGDLPSGVYFYRLKAAGFSGTNKLLLIR